MTFKILELYGGIGGCAAAVEPHGCQVTSVEINQKALQVYRLNFSHACKVRSIESVSTDELAEEKADLWWLSPPCQPHTIRGRLRDAHDSRSLSFLTLTEQIRKIRPRYIALENVPGFRLSESYRCFLAALLDCRYQVRGCLLCPTDLGVPNRRRRFYVIGAKEGNLQPWFQASEPVAPLQSFLDEQWEPRLLVPPQQLLRFRRVMDIVDPALSPDVIVKCFTSGYGRSMAHSGSYLKTREGARFFSPYEILRLLGFPKGYRLPTELSLREQWSLVGNSLSVVAVRRVLSAIPELG